MNTVITKPVQPVPITGKIVIPKPVVTEIRCFQPGRISEARERGA